MSVSFPLRFPSPGHWLAAVAVGAGLAGAASHAAVLCTVGPELWDRPRSGRSLLALEAVKPCVLAFNRDSRSRLVIHHAPAPEPALMAEELRTWFTALALDADRLELGADGQGSALVIEIRDAKP
ncbi:MAG: hypothetical protein HYU77_06965 [Betaproteobacteria bacterium]|nr:hypothetical protein [Betaproteobacteria bacterium]